MPEDSISPMECGIIPPLTGSYLLDHLFLPFGKRDVQGCDLGVPMWVVEVRKGVSTLPRSVLHPMEGGFVQALRHYFQNIADVDHKGIRDWLDLDPCSIDLLGL